MVNANGDSDHHNVSDECVALSNRRTLCNRMRLVFGDCLDGFFSSVVRSLVLLVCECSNRIDDTYIVAQVECERSEPNSIWTSVTDYTHKYMPNGMVDRNTN